MGDRTNAKSLIDGPTIIDRSMILRSKNTYTYRTIAIHFKVHLDEERSCILLLTAEEDGDK